MNFRFITLKEPSKKDMIPFLEHEQRFELSTITPPARIARVQVIRKDFMHGQLFECLVDLHDMKVVKLRHLKGRHSYIDSAYMQDVETVCLTDSEIRAEIKKLELPNEATVCVEPWAYATDGMNDMSERITMVRSS